MILYCRLNVKYLCASRRVKSKITHLEATYYFQSSSHPSLVALYHKNTPVHKPINVGVPQRSVLGPIFYLAHTDNLRKFKEKRLETFADRKKTEKTVEEARNRLQNVVNNITYGMHNKVENKIK